jgi:acetoin utilization deacetylase AcuC-like enzyme
MSGHFVSTAAYTTLARRTLELARQLCGGRCVGVLEGGYATGSLADCAGAALAVLAGEHVEPLLAELRPGATPPAQPGGATAPVDAVVEIQRQNWQLAE